ncbi:MAG: carbohydrate ABC transporter permease [Anaerolineales bacterium]|nr:carbohydrate ABC transporter permease [Anaerolineales bacterium]MDW8161979.1 carbohydrate ABC transporter permease [Anaerolineales bacterium]
MSRRKLVESVLINAFLLLFCLIILFPVVYSFLVSFHEPKTAFLSILPQRWTLENYARLFRYGQFPRYILNSIINGVGGAVVTTIAATLTAYALARFDFKGKGAIEAFILGMMMLPGLTNLIPILKIASDLGLLNTYTLMILVFGAYGVPLSIWIMKGFFESIPRVLEEAAAIDGATPVQTFLRVVLPITTPGLIATLLINFVYNWNNFLTPLILINKTSMKMATVGLFDFQHVLEGNQDELLAAACVVIMVPALVLFLRLRDYFLQGMIEGAVKG